MWSILWVVCLGDFDGGYNVVQFGVHRRCKQCYPEIITVQVNPKLKYSPVFHLRISLFVPCSSLFGVQFIFKVHT